MIPEIAEDQEPVINPRTAAMDAIAASAQKARDAEMAEDSILDDEPKPQALVEPDDALELDNGALTHNTPVIERDGKQFLELTVNGEKQEIALDDAVAKLQQNENANLQTKIAVDKQHQLDAQLAQLQQAKLKGKSTQPDDTLKSRAEMLEIVTESQQKLYDDGDVKGSSELLVDLLMDKQQPVAAPAADEALITQIVAKRENMRSIKDAFTVFSADERFSDMVRDRDLLTMVDKITDRLQSDSEFMANSPSHLDIFEKAGETVLDKLGIVKPAKETASILEKKRAAPSAVASRTSRRTEPVPKSAPTTSEIIKGMARDRGQTDH